MRGINSGNMNSARMATVTAVTFIVAFAPVLCGPVQIKADPNPVDCSSGQKGTQEVNVSEPNTTLTLKCSDSAKGKVKPPFRTSPFEVCIDQDCASPARLSEYIAGATGKEVNETSATVQIKDLPPAPKTFYVQCGDTDPCYILVKVAQAPSTPGGVTTGSLLSCATPGKAITIKIPEKGSKAQFTCGNLTLYPLATDRVFAENCKKEESLKDIVRSAEGGVYTLTADKKPPKRKWCYLCARSSVTSENPGGASDYCLVHVESSSRTQSRSAIALAATLPCVLATLRIT